MTAERWHKLKELISRALELEEDVRDAYLVEACNDDKELLREARSLLHASQKHGALDQSLANITRAAFQRFEGAGLKGKQIGSYKIIRELGDGGMGSVYLAERADQQYEQRVALKILRSGFALQEQTRRFLAERQILAALDHENIARLLDGGVTAEGQPYFVMEFVEGEAMDRYCDRCRLSIRKRLELFLTVCSAVQYAHRKLIVHCDIKPSNILVNRDGKVKLLDFGIATILSDDPPLPDSVPLTRGGLLPLTPSYASPEQVRGDMISTASDIYQLGVVLYELLTGCRPYQVTGRTPGETETIICEEPPTRPSLVLARQPASDGEEARPDPTGIARMRQTTPKQFQRQLRGDLDTIVLKTLAKEPERRYESIEQLIGDLQRHLAGQPVSAHPDFWMYRAGKYVRRYQFRVTAIAVIVLLMVSYAVTVTWHSRRTEAALEKAQLEAEKSEQITDFLMGLFKANDPAVAMGDTVTAGVLLERGIERAEQLDDQPDIQAQMFDVMGKVYLSLGRYKKAVSLLNKAIEVRQAYFGDTSLQVAHSHYHLGLAKHHSGSYHESARHFDRAVEIYRMHPGQVSDEIANCLHYIANMKNVAGRASEAEALHREALAIRRTLLGEAHPDVALSYQGIGQSLMFQGEVRGALQYLRRALGILHRTNRGDDPQIAELLANLGRVYRDMEDYDAAETHLLQALEMRRRIFGNTHPQTGMSMKELADLYQDDGKFEAAESLYRETLSMIRNEFGDQHPLKRPVLQSLARLYMQTGAHDEAEPLLRRTLAMLEAVFPPNHSRVLAVRRQLGVCLASLQKYAEAESLLTSTYRTLKSKHGSEHETTQQTMNDLIKLYEGWGKPELAATYRHEQRSHF